MNNTVEGRFWISKSEHSFLGKGRIELLRFIEETGSITQAAKMMKMSYKAAWDTVDIMNNLSEFLLVKRVKGGKGGGGTELTPYAKELISTFKVLEEEHHNFLNALSKRLQERDGHFRLLESLSIRISARNQLKVKIVKIQKGTVESELFLHHEGEKTFSAIITNDSLETLDLKVGTEVYALFKANAVNVGIDKEQEISGQNRFVGNINRISRGNFDAEIVVELQGGSTICSTMTLDALNALNLQNGMEVVVFCKPSSIIIGIW